MSTDADSSAASNAPSGREAETVVELQDEVEQLKQAVWAHATVDQAIGVVVVLGQLSPDEAWNVIRQVSMRTNTKLREVAQQIVTWGRTGALDDVLSHELRGQIRQQQGPAVGPGGEQ
ncbi:ANTAR domain-containing protein [Streptomyces sp. NPDC002853]